MDDRRAGLVIRTLRRRRGWRQVDLAKAARASQTVISRAERGHFDTLSLRAVRAIFNALDARLGLDVRWRGGELERVLDSRHAALVAAPSELLADWGWSVRQEMTYSVYGERGSVDAVAMRELERIAVAFEMKVELTSWEETQRRFDAKVRLLPGIIAEQFGWRPRVVAQVLVLEDTMTNRRRVAALGRAAQQMYPARGRQVRAWLKSPDGPLRGMWFVSVSHRRTASGPRGGPHRIRVPRSRSGERRTSGGEPSDRASTGREPITG